MFFVALIINLLGDVLVARHFGVAGIAVVSSTVYVALDLAMTVTALRYAARADAGSSPQGVHRPQLGGRRFTSRAGHRSYS